MAEIKDPENTLLMETTKGNVVIEMFPDLEGPLQAIIDRLWDLHPVVKANYYHPKMLGSWSIKAVLPTMNPAMDYALLEGIKDLSIQDGLQLAPGSRLVGLSGVIGCGLL